MIRCDSCGTEVTAVDPNGDGLKCGCALSNPLERAARAINDLDPHPSMKWERTTDFWRNTARRDARAALDAAVDAEELAEHIGAEHARLVRDHLLGSSHE